MTGPQRPRGNEGHPPEIEIDTRVAHPARVHNYLAGGDGNFAVDREAVDQAAAVLPGGMETARRALAAMVAFHTRVIRYLVTDAGVRQFLKVGTAVPAGEDVHEIALSIAPDVRVVYVGDDPMVLAHAHSMRRARPKGSTAYVHGSLRDAEAIMREAAATLDLDRPVALLLPATLNFVPDEDDPGGIVARLVAAMAPGSYVVLTHSSHDNRTGRMEEAAERFSKLLGEPYVVRTRDEIARFFDGLELVEPGLVQVDEWPPGPGTSGAGPDGADADAALVPAPIFGGVGRKP